MQRSPITWPRMTTLAWVKTRAAEALSKVFKALHCGGAADVVKVAIKTSKPSQITEMDYAILGFRNANPSTPAVGLCMGAAGKLSRVSNKFLTFSTHPLLPGTAAPGQLTAEEIRTLKIELGMLPAEVSVCTCIHVHACVCTCIRTQMRAVA